MAHIWMLEGAAVEDPCRQGLLLEAEADEEV